MEVDQSADDSAEYDLLAVGTVEDFIDVENEMGFGEGEDWESEDNVESVQHSSQKRAAHRVAHNNFRAKSGFQARQAEQRSVDLERRGRKGVDAKHKVAEEGNQEGKEESKMQRTIGEEETGQGRFVHWGEDPDDTQIDYRDSLQQQRKHDEVDGSIHEDLRGSGEESEQEQRVEQKSEMEKRQDKAGNRNRVKFVDTEKSEKPGGNSRKGGELRRRSKGRPQQELPWRFGRTAQTENPGYGVEKAAVRIGEPVKRKEPIVVATRESRKDTTLEVEKSTEMWREERKALRLAQDKIEKLEDVLQRQQEIVVNMKSSLGSEDAKDAYGKLKQLLDALSSNFRKLPFAPKLRHAHPPESSQLKSKLEQIDKLKAQCNLLELERDRLKKKMRFLLESSKGREKELEALTSERERVLEIKVRNLEGSLCDWESKFRKIEAEFSIEKEAWKQNLSACKFDWKDKKQRWATKLKDREAELSRFKTTQDKLIDSLFSSLQCINELKKLVIPIPKEHEESCPAGFVVAKQVESGSHEQMDTLELALNIQAEVEDIRKVLCLSSETSASEWEAKEPSEILKKERQTLDDKVAKTLSLMEDLKQEMKAKEYQIKRENEKLGHTIAAKVEQVETLEQQLAEKEKGMEAIMQQLTNDASQLNQEIEQERGERLRLLDMQAEMKRKLMKGLRKREQKWEEEVEMLKGKLDEMTADITLKDEKIERLDEELNAKAIQLDQEKQKWNAAVKEVKEKAAKTILRFVHGKENGLLQHLSERRKGRKAGAGGTNVTDKVEESEPYTSTCQDNYSDGSTNDRMQKRHHMKARSLELNDTQRSPREWKHSSKCEIECDKLDLNVDKGKSLECQKFRTKKYDDFRRRKERVGASLPHDVEEEFHEVGGRWFGNKHQLEWLPKKKDALKHLDKKVSSDNAFTIIQDTLQELEWPSRRRQKEDDN